MQHLKLILLCGLPSSRHPLKGAPKGLIIIEACLQFRSDTSQLVEGSFIPTCWFDLDDDDDEAMTNSGSNVQHPV